MIRRFSLLLLALVAFALAADATGKWTATFNTKLTGKYTSSNGEGVITDGKVDGDKLSWVENLKYQDMDLRGSGADLKVSRDVAGIATEEAVAQRVKKSQTHQLKEDQIDRP
ncbi:MAG TPA: hypothetical protein VG297_07925 [Bryobacteraceae bacterium]|jgi:hypothetical protein|nr:hypothetical protein [Bryobacteraceae bacterium]